MSKAAKPGTIRWHEENVKALDESIEHWCRLRDLKQEEGEQPTSDWCACCVLDEQRCDSNPREYNGSCSSCPIMDFTGKLWCDGTPYYAAANAWRFCDRACVADPGARQLMQAEVDFLVKVRRSEQRKLENLQAK